MKGKIFLVLLISLAVISVVSAGILSNNYFNLKGVFGGKNGWSGLAGISPYGGYPGVVYYNTGGTQIYPDTNSNGLLSGSIWLGNVGWVTFSHGVAGHEVLIDCPPNIWTQSDQYCYLTGDAWSQNAGWIVLSGAQIGGSASGVYFDPNTSNLSGYGWSRSLGWVPFWTGLTGSITVVPPPGDIGDALNGVSLNFISKVAIIGNIAGSRVYAAGSNTYYNQDVGYSYKTINHANILNLIRKNIALLRRNVSSADLADANSNLNYVIREKPYTINPDLRINIPGDLLVYTLASVPKRTIIVIGGDIILNDIDINAATWNNQNVGFIALKDEFGSGGNIVITNKVKQVYAYLYAEGSLYSGEKGTNPGDPIIPYTDDGVWNIPKGQLYVRGFIASKNTIGGTQQSPVVCPVLTDTCTATGAQQYDWDYFRTYDPTDPAQGSLPLERSGSVTQRIQDATMIIEYDDDIIKDPPPGFKEM